MIGGTPTILRMKGLQRCFNTVSPSKFFCCTDIVLCSERQQGPIEEDGAGGSSQHTWMAGVPPAPSPATGPCCSWPHSGWSHPHCTGKISEEDTALISTAAPNSKRLDPHQS